MKKIHFEIHINAPREKVWDTMLGEQTYPQWTKPFNPTSSFRGDWSEGSKIFFIGTDEDGKETGGMVSRIKENRLYEFLSIEHLGMYKDGKEDTTSDEVLAWTPAFENYTFAEMDGGTHLCIDMDVPEAHKAMFEDMWPKALERLKELCEG